MAMGRREQPRRQEELWIAHTQLPRTAAHPFYEQLNWLLEGVGLTMGGAAMRALLCGEDGAAESGAGAVLPFAAGRGSVRGAWAAAAQCDPAPESDFITMSAPFDPE
jgi:hypothetical protein